MRAHFTLIKVKLKRTFSLTASCIETSETQNISLQEQVLNVLKCTDENSLVALGKYLFLAVQMRKKSTQKWCISTVVRFLCLKRCWLKLCIPHLELSIRSV